MSHLSVNLADDGYVLVPGVLNADQVRWARQAIDRMTPIHWDYTGLVDHYKCIFNRDAGWLPYLDLSPLIELMEEILGSDCHIVGQTAWRCHPGFWGADLHVDYLVAELPESWLATPGFVFPAQICTVHYYLNDIDQDLCPTWVIPGSHKAGRAPYAGEQCWNGNYPIPILCRAGDALVLRSDLWHSGSQNKTQDQIRYLLQVHYGRRMVAQKFSPYLRWQFDAEILARATPRQRRLLGDHEEAEYD